MRCRVFAVLSAVAFAAAAAVSPAPAAFVNIQDYEAVTALPDNTIAFGTDASLAGQSTGFDTTTSGGTTLQTANGVEGPTGKFAQFPITDAAGKGEQGTWEWQVRWDSNGTAGPSATNPTFATTGYVGYWLNQAPGGAVVQTAPLVELATTGTATGGRLQTVIADGAWHFYSWSFGTPGDFPNTFNDIFGGGIGDTTIEPTVSYDSIAFVSVNGGNATIGADRIGYDLSPIPEPVLTPLITATLLGLLVRRRQRENL